MGGHQPRIPTAPRTVTARALAILGAFTLEEPRLTQSEISDIAGLPLSTAYRLVTELHRWGALERDTDLRYRIGPKVRELAALSIGTSREPGAVERRDPAQPPGAGRDDPPQEHLGGRLA